MTNSRVDPSVARRLQRDVLRHMTETRGKKYRSWLLKMNLGMWIFLPQSKRRAIMNAVYAALRRVDDVVDGDFDAYRGYADTPCGYTEKLLAYLENVSGEPRNEVEWLLRYAFTVSREVGLDIREGVRKVVRSLRFDANRRVTNYAAPLKVLARNDLDYQFDRLDIEGTIDPCLKLAGEYEKGIRCDHLRFLGIATRIFFTLRDLEEDVLAGYCNIPAEDVYHLGIKLPNREIPGSVAVWCRSEPVREWRVHEVGRALNMLASHVRDMDEPPLKDLYLRTRLVLNVMYETPARAGLERILDNANCQGPLLPRSRP